VRSSSPRRFFQPRRPPTRQEKRRCPDCSKNLRIQILTETSSFPGHGFWKCGRSRKLEGEGRTRRVFIPGWSFRRPHRRSVQSAPWRVACGVRYSVVDNARAHLGFHLLELGQQAVTPGFPFEQEFPIATDAAEPRNRLLGLPYLLSQKSAVAASYRIIHASNVRLQSAGCYELRETSQGQLVLFGSAGHVAYRMCSLLPSGAGTRNNSAKSAYVRAHL
jgi:hypothetical protein